MNEIKKQVLTLALVATFIGAGLVSTNTIYAQSTTATNPISTLVEKLATRFGLKTNEVQTIFDQHRQERQSDMQTKFVERLTQ